MATKAWLPVGFKMTDFSHLGEGSYCFCSKCRARLFPKRTNAEKAQARLAAAATKQAQLDALEAAELGEEVTDEEVSTPDIDVEELEVESVELADLDQGAVAIDDDSSCQLSSDDG